MIDQRSFLSSWRLSALSANLKTSLAIESFILVMGSIVIIRDRVAGEIFLAIIVAAYQIACGYLSNFRYRLACYLIAVPNLLLASLIVFFADLAETISEPLILLWIFSTTSIGLYASFASRLPTTANGNSPDPASPHNDA